MVARSVSIHSPIAIVWCTPYCHYFVVEHKLVSLHGELMGSSDEVDSIMMRKDFGDICTKEKPSTTGTQTPAGDIWGANESGLGEGRSSN